MPTITTLPRKRASVLETILPLMSGNAELERLGRILHARMTRRIGRLGHALQLRLGRLDGDHLLRAVANDLERAVFLRRQLEHQRTRAGEVADDELAVAEGAGQRAGVAVDAQNRRGHFSARLPHDEAPRRLALVAVDVADLPQAVDLRHFVRERGRRREFLRVERIEAGARDCRRRRAGRSRAPLRPRRVVIEVQRQRSVLELPAGRRHLLVAVEEPSADRRRRCRRSRSGTGSRGR